VNVLNSINEHGAEWNYLYAQTQVGLGKRMEALRYAKIAMSMSPNDMRYHSLVMQLEGNTSFYRQNGTDMGFDIPTILCGNPCLTCCALNVLCNCCCGPTCYCR
jgi:hypothetical protein